MTPTIVISKPLAHHERVVTSDLDAPTTKCASVLMTNEAITAGMPTVKKKGIIGMNPPIAVDTAADTVERHGLGNDSSDKPSSSWTSVRRNLEIVAQEIVTPEISDVLSKAPVCLA